LVRTRIDMTNGAKTPVRQNTMVRFWQRAINRILSSVASVSREQLALWRRPRWLENAARIYALIDRDLVTFYDDPSAVIHGDTHQETAALKRQLRRIARFVERQRGSAPVKLNAMIAQS
jgi:hypothetical protein